MIPLNVQLPEKQLTDEVTTLDVQEVFRTLQGEGPFSGRPAAFCRLAGCNLKCPNCDTDYTSKRFTTSVDLLLDLIYKTLPKNGIVVLTGGEPFRQNIGVLTTLLAKRFTTVQIETNGTLFVEDFPFWSAFIHLVISPKTGGLNRLLLDALTTRTSNHPYLKYVLSAGEIDDDGLPTKSLGESSRPWRPKDLERWVSKGRVYVSPCDDENKEENTKAAINSCMKFGYTLSLQTHKILNLP